MTKKEVIWREILQGARTQNKTIFTQKELAAVFGFSTSTVFNALKIPRAANAVKVSGRNFRLESYEKLLYLWASHRSLAKDIFYKAELKENAQSIESAMPPIVNFGLYSAMHLLYKSEPADYDHTYIYLDRHKLGEVMKRLSNPDSKSSHPNFFVLQPDPWLSRYRRMPLEQIFVDIWNAPEWYSKDFLKILKEKLPL